MLVSMQADYALRVLVDVAQQEALGHTVVTREIAERQHVPPVFLTKIVAQLAAAKLLHTQRGKHGGVSLGMPAEQINVLDIIETFEGHLNFNHCVADPGYCSKSPSCTVRVLWHDAEDHLTSFFRQQTLAMLLERIKTSEPEVLKREPAVLARIAKVDRLPVQQPE